MVEYFSNFINAMFFFEIMIVFWEQHFAQM